MPDNCTKDCPVLPRVEALEEANKNHGRVHEKMYERIQALEKENAVQNAHYKAIDEKLDELTAMVKELTGKPGKRWDSLVDKLLCAAAGAVITWLAAGMPGWGI